jgi:TP901 family phage tail tape measure protein
VSTAEAEANATRLSETYGESAASILLSTAEFKQAGFDIESAMVLTAASMDLVIAGGLETAQASELIVAALKGFGEEADQTSRFVDILNEVSNNYATNVEELAIGMSTLSPIADQMGFSMEETAGVLTPVIEIFRSGNEAATSLKTGLLKLIDDSKPVADALASIGVSQKDANGDLRAGKDIFYDVAEAFVDLDENQKLFTKSQLVGIKQAGKMVTVFDDLNKVQGVTATALGSSGSAALEVAARLESAEVSVGIFKASFENLSVAVGTQFKLAAQEAIDGGSSISQALRDSVEAGAFDEIFNAINEFGSKLGDALEGIADELPAALEGVDFKELVASFEGVIDSIKNLFKEMDIDLTTTEGLTKAIQEVVDGIALLQNVTGGIVTAFTPMIVAIKDAVTWFGTLDEDTQAVAGQILGFGAQLTVLAGILATGGAVVAGIGALSGLFAAGGALATGIGATSAALTLLMANPFFAGVASLAIGWEIGEQIRKLVPEVDGLTQKMWRAVDSVINFSGQKGNVDLGNNLGEVTAAADTVSKHLYAIPDRKDIEISAALASDWDAVNTEVDSFSDKEVEVSVTADITQAQEEVSWFDEEGNRHSIMVDVETSGVEDAKDKIEKIPSEKLVQIQLQGDIDTKIAQITASADVAAAAFEWTAQVDIAQAESAAREVAAAFEAASSSVDATASAASSMFGDLIGSMDELSTFDKWAMQGVIEDQMDMQAKALDSQIKLNDAQVAYMEARTEALEGGESLITIDSTGLEPALETIMWEIIEKVQLRASEESADFLLGIA